MESGDAALGLAVERDEALHLGRLLDVVLNAVERLRAVEAVAVKEAMRLLERLNRLAREAAARKPDDIDADETRGSFPTGCSANSG